MRNDAAYRALRAEWRQKLAASGFVDLEYPDGSLRSGVPGPVQEPRDAYFAAARDAVSAAGFDRRYSPRQQRILELHAEGERHREIARAVRCRYGEVLEAIEALRRQIGVRP